MSPRPDIFPVVCVVCDVACGFVRSSPSPDDDTDDSENF
jgi:hypothetical protein